MFRIKILDLALLLSQIPHFAIIYVSGFSLDVTSSIKTLLNTHSSLTLRSYGMPLFCVLDSLSQ